MMAHKYGIKPEFEHLPHKVIRTNRVTNILNWLLFSAQLLVHLVNRSVMGRQPYTHQA